MKAIKQSAGILLYRFVNKQPEFFLVHPGGPFWAKKDAGAWSIPKGEFINEDPLEAAKREFEEETGIKPTFKNYIALTPVKLKSGKKVFAWAAEGNMDETAVKSNLFNMEWPPRSGKTISVPEIDKAAWFEEQVAIEKINASQSTLITELLGILERR